MRLTGGRGVLAGPGARAGAALALAAAAACLAALWASGGFAMLGHWALGQQRELQALLARHLQSVRGGEPFALWSLVGLAAAYGFLHAVGPGHGKVLVTGAALGTRATARRMAGIALAGSIAQALFAIAIVYGTFALFTATARGTVEASDAWLEPIGHLVVAAVGAWLILRGLRAAGALRTAGGEGRRHAHDGEHGCGHAHAPDAEAVAGATGLREAAALVAAMAVRPCTGALVVLVLAWRFDIAAAGAGAVIAMGLGTAAFTMLVAGLAVGGREAAFLSAGGGPAARRLGAVLQIAAGSLILLVSGMLLATALGSG